MNVSVPTDMIFFCIRQTANYLQKYIVIRKENFIGQRTIAELLDVMKDTMVKFPDEKYLFLVQILHVIRYLSFLKKMVVNIQRKLFNAVPRDLKKLKKVFCDILVFYTPCGIILS